VEIDRRPSLQRAYDQPVSLRHFLLRNRADGTKTTFAVDSLFPKTLEGVTDMNAVDEGTADLLYGLVRGIRPRVCLETGTHKGRSTRAIVSALRANAELDLMPYAYTVFADTPGHLWTVDEKDYGLQTEGALREGEHLYVTQVVGRTPAALAEPPFDTLEGIDFAFLDGDHTAEGLDAELVYVDLHRASECLVAIENSRDPGWPGVKRTLEGYHKYPRISLPTCCGVDLIWMR
jgi:hypothetical protein